MTNEPSATCKPTKPNIIDRTWPFSSHRADHSVLARLDARLEVPPHPIDLGLETLLHAAEPLREDIGPRVEPRHGHEEVVSSRGLD